jgi:hypothetical protein
VIRKVQKEDITQLEVERQRFERAVDVLVEKRGCTRTDAAVVMATVNPGDKKFIKASQLAVNQLSLRRFTSVCSIQVFVKSHYERQQKLRGRNARHHQTLRRSACQ